MAALIHELTSEVLRAGINYHGTAIHNYYNHTVSAT